MHGKVEIGIIMFYGADMLLYRYVYIQFLTDFPTERFFGRFARFYLASREFPKSLEIPIPTLGGEDLSVLMNDGCYYFDGFHDAKIANLFGIAFVKPIYHDHFHPFEWTQK